ncbi:MAG TPA: DUF4126 domain-containing protein [Glaciihabitans sp.]|jgi:hypothetical protein|nr:DUF4126 domain-containing protein [Glaciihabitans sp.]
MLELLAGTGLAIAAGLNAYIPLLVLGAAGKFIDAIQLPDGWAWLSNDWVLIVLGVLLVIELIADKIPVVDSINDWIQTVIRPASGGIAFGTGSASQTTAIEDPAAFVDSGQWIGVATGVAIALGVHLLKMSIRPILNAMTIGAAAPLVSSLEDIGSAVLSVLALLLPFLIIFAVVGMVFGVLALRRRIVLHRRGTPGIAKRPAP